MKHVRDAVEQARQLELAQIAFDEFEAVAAAQGLEVPFLQRPWIEIGECVDGAHPRALREQALTEMGPDESGGPRDERLHAKRSFTRSGIRVGRPCRSMVAWIV
jgi:hypothetical protein